MASPSSPPSAIAITESSPALLTTRRGLPPPCWSQDETLALIESYRDKWHSLSCGNLRAADWEQVSAEVARRSSLLPSSTPKTSIQCRHKIEKLRKRFRSERLRSLTRRPSSPWPFLSIMESLEHTPPSLSDCIPAGNTRSLHRHIPDGGELLRLTFPKALRSKIVNPCSADGRAAKPSLEELRRRMERKRIEEREREGDAVGKMISSLRMVGDGFLRMERMKMDLARETERMRMEMELKRTEMILDLQGQVVDAFVKRFVNRVHKKAKVSPDA